MKVSQLRRRSSLVVAIAAAVFGSGVSAGNPGNAGGEEAVAAGAQRLGVKAAHDAASGQEVQRARFIVGLKDAPLALAPAIPRRDNQRIALESLVAQSYVAQLQAKQAAFLDRASALLGRQIQPLMQFQHAYNGFVAELSDAEASRLLSLPDVARVELDVDLPVDTDRGPTMINAPAVWDGSGTLGNLPSKGAGVVVGVIDTGLNIGSPSYAAMGADGYAHVNPLGPGNYLGWCNPSNPNHDATRDLCNDKLIGGWDFTDALATTAVFEARGFEDEGGHGSHTSSTAVGNARTATFNGITRNISGVAPHANLVIYDVCYTTPTGGSCPTAATTAAINQAVADGIIDVLSYSISGGGQPWTEGGSLAFLAAQNAGIIVAASAGNSGPTAATVGHQEPWTITVGGTMHDRVFGFSFSMTAPLPLPSNTQNVTVRPGGAPIASATLTGPLIVSPNFANGTSDGCSAFPANFFRRPATAGGTQGIAVLRLDSVTSACGSGARRTAALAAGASGVIFVDVAPLNLGATDTSYSMLARDWNNVAAHLATNPAAADARIEVPLTVTPGAPDAIYYSSSRGPSNFPLLKPDVAAPGVEILAAYDRWTAAAPAPFGGTADPAQNTIVNAISGTSMAAPHVAGSAALLRSLNRSWTPAQVKSALMTTAKPDLFEVDGTTPATPFSVGAGRIDVARASKAGLILDESGANYSAANPATGGNPSQLNVASFQNLACVGTCTFPRTLKSTRTAPVTWTATVNGFAAGVVTPSPASFTLANAASQAFTLGIDSTQLPAGQNVFGELVLTPNNAAIPTARMPIAVRAALPDIEVTPPLLSAGVAEGGSVGRTLNVRNVGNPMINWDVATTGTAPFALQRQAYDGIRGNASNFFSGISAGFYQAEDFVSPDPATLAMLDVDGFMTGTGGTLQATATQITFKVYSDAAGQPAGNPEAGSGGEIYSCVRTPTGINSGGLIFRTTDGARFALDVNAAASAGCPVPPTLTAGTRYWAVVYPTVPGNSAARRWIYGRATSSNGLAPMTFASPSLGTAAWTALTAVTTPPTSLASLALGVTTNVDCSAPWLSVAPNSGSLGVAGADAPVVTANSASLALGSYRGYVCIDSNGTDADEPVTPIPFVLNVTDWIFVDNFEGAP